MSSPLVAKPSTSQRTCGPGMKAPSSRVPTSASSGRSMWRLSDRDQLALELDEAPPRNAEELRVRLQRLGLGARYRVRLTTNRTVVVSYSGGELRIHNSFLGADEEVWKAIIVFVHGRNRAGR